MIETVLEQLKNQRKDLELFIEKLDNEVLKLSKESGWTVSEVLEHLYLTEKSIVKGIVYYANQSEAQKAEEKPLHYVLDRSIKIEAPKSILPSGESMTKEQHFEQLGKSREGLLQAIQEIDESKLKQHSFPNAILGPLSLLQWIEFIGLHEQRHILQMNEILTYHEVG
jgi:cell division protein FtsB